MELPNKNLEQIALNTRSKIEDYMLIVMDKSTKSIYINHSKLIINNLK